MIQRNILDSIQGYLDRVLYPGEPLCEAIRRMPSRRAKLWIVEGHNYRRVSDSYSKEIDLARSRGISMSGISRTLHQCIFSQPKISTLVRVYLTSDERAINWKNSFSQNGQTYGVYMKDDEEFSAFLFGNIEYLHVAGIYSSQDDSKDFDNIVGFAVSIYDGEAFLVHLS